MMSAVLTSLCSALLRERYGDAVQKVGTFLMKYISSCSLAVIVKDISLPLETVKLSLSVLIRHGFCTFSQHEKGFVEYNVKHENVLLLLHYESYACYAQMLCGDLADALVMEILNNGYLTMSDALLNVFERLQDTKDAHGFGYSLSTIQEKFVQLVEKHFLIRCPYPHPSNNNRMPNLSISEQELFIVPKIQLNLLESSLTDEPSPKKRKIEYPDKGVYWKVNHDRYIEYFRNDSIVHACANHMDDKAAEVVKTILTLSENKSNRLSPTTSAVSQNEILQKILQTTSIKAQELDSYLSILCEGMESFVSKADDRSGGMYVVNIAKILQRLVHSLATSVVRDRFGSKCARIFRILLSKKVLEPKHVEELAMLHPKDTKEYIYQMFKEAFIVSHEIPKGSDYSHGQPFYLLRVNIVQVCQMLLENCYHALFNLFTCSEIQNEENKRLLEKKQRIDAIVASLMQNGADEEQIQEVQNIITPPEEAVIKKVAVCSEKIDNGQRQIAEMVLLLSIWLEFSRCR